MVDREKRIQEIAYQLWVRDGRPEGRSDRHWHEALALFEAEVAEPAAAERPAEPAPGRSAKPRPAESDAGKPSSAKSKAGEPAARKPAASAKPHSAEKAAAKAPAGDKASEPPAEKPVRPAAKRKPAKT